jgi:hypothetical protein
VRRQLGQLAVMHQVLSDTLAELAHT